VRLPRYREEQRTGKVSPKDPLGEAHRMPADNADTLTGRENLTDFSEPKKSLFE